MSPLHPRFEDPAAIATLQQQWRRDRCLRVPDVLAPGLADQLAEFALSGPFELYHRHESEIRCLLWRRYVAFEDLGELAERVESLVERDIPSLVSAIVGRSMTSPGNTGVAFDSFRKGSYLDAHTDQAPHRIVAYVIGLTRDRWDRAGGGQLEFLSADGQTVIDSRSPGFDTLDMYNIYPLLRWHRVSLQRVHAVRLAANGWLSGDVADPMET